jgi:hypothetical protein
VHDVSEELADASVLAAWPDAVELVARASGKIDRGADEDGARFAQAVVLTLAAEEGRVADEWARDRLQWLATVVVPGLLDDLREARTMAARMDVDTFARFLATSTRWPAAPPLVLCALCALRPELRPVLERRAERLGHPNPLDHVKPPEDPR